ncbi:MAG: helix-turn-helix transcriptional regulator [Tissierellales bacterium]|nr:helix-turn-helix transcriptional regulator [Tissierellales bacterium]
MSIQTIETMVNWVEDNITEDPTLGEMSNHVGYSSYYCSSQFHEVVGLSFKAYINKRKLSQAATELVQTGDRIIDIAVKYGFSSHEAFTRAFAREFGYSPSKYRRELPTISLYEKPIIRHSH